MILIPHQLFYFILYLLLLLSKAKKESKKRTKNDFARYKQIDYLKNKISKYPFYSLIHVSDEIMCIDKNEIPDRQARILSQKKLVHNRAIMVLRGSLSVGAYKYARSGYLFNWIFVFKFARGAS